MALDDFDQTVRPRKKPKLAQLTANSQAGAGGDNTASNGSRNFIQKFGAPGSSGEQLAKTFKQGGIIGVLGEGAKQTYEDIAPVVSGTGRVLKEALVGESTPAKLAPTPLANNIATPSPKPIVPIEQPPISSGPISLSRIGETKTLEGPGFSVSSSSPRLGNITQPELSSLERTIANDKNPEVIQHRAESAALSQKSYDDYLRGGKTRAEFESEQSNPLSTSSLYSNLQKARQVGDVQGFSLYKGLLDKQIKAGATTPRDTVEAAKLGYNQLKDQRAFDAGQTNKLTDQAISIQNKKAENTLGLLKAWHSPESMSSEMSPGQKLQQALGTGANISQLDTDIFGSDVSSQLHNAPDRTTKLKILLGQLSPELAAAYIDNTTQ